MIEIFIQGQPYYVIQYYKHDADQLDLSVIEMYASFRALIAWGGGYSISFILSEISSKQRLIDNPWVQYVH